MSNSATGPTSTTASSPNSASERQGHQEGDTDFGRDEAVHSGPVSGPNAVNARRGAFREAPIEIVACGALAGHIREIAARRGWPVVVRPLPAALHNRPEKIKGQAERSLQPARTHGSRAILGYADCGTYGALDDLAAAAGASRLPGLHCYDLYAGAGVIERLFAEEPGTYLLTDYLIRSWERSVVEPLGLDRYPQLWTDYFGHYRRLVWLAQEATPDLEEKAAAIASRFNLPLARVDTGTGGLEEALAALIEPLP
jgi:hypothetical protein